MGELGGGLGSFSNGQVSRRWMDMGERAVVLRFLLGIGVVRSGNGRRRETIHSLYDISTWVWEERRKQEYDHDKRMMWEKKEGNDDGNAGWMMIQKGKRDSLP